MMRLMLGLMGLLVVLVVGSVLAKKQLAATVAVPLAPVTWQAHSGPLPSLPETSFAATHEPVSQVLTIQEQVRQSVEAAMKHPRAVDGE